MQLNTFLQRFEPLADFSQENLKHPADAVEMKLPSSKAQADARNTRKFTSGEILDLLSIYVDMLDLAGAEGTELDLLLVDFLNVTTQAYLDGAIKPAAVSAEPEIDTTAPEETADVTPQISAQAENDSGGAEVAKAGRGTLRGKIRAVIQSFPLAELQTIAPKDVMKKLEAEGIEITAAVRTSTSVLLKEAKAAGVIVPAAPLVQLHEEAAVPADAPVAAPPPEPSDVEKPKKKTRSKATAKASLDTTQYKVGTRIVWTPPSVMNAPPMRGVIKATDGETACDIMLDDGQLIFNVPMISLHVKSVEQDPLPDVPFDYDRNPITDIKLLTYPMTSEMISDIENKMNPVHDDQLPGTLKIQPPGTILFEMSLRVENTSYYVQVHVVTAVPQTVVIAKLVDVEQNRIVHVLPPRRTIVGNYTFVDQAAAKVVKLDIPKG